jgi:DNA-binding response OmpR family regulator
MILLYYMVNYVSVHLKRSKLIADKKIKMYSSTLTPSSPYINTTIPTARVLIIESNSTLRRLFDQPLRQAGFRTLFSATGNQAETLIASFQPDIVLIDFDLPDVNGLDLIRSIKARGNDHIPAIIALSEHDQHHYRATGLAHFFAKPVRVVALIDVLRRISSTRGC